MKYFLTFLYFLIATVHAADEISFVLQNDVPYTGAVASQSLLSWSTFANSWDRPLQIQYVPATTEFNRVVLELQVNTTGTNYDRLAQIYLNGVEIWRSSTAEPDTHNTSWSVHKDVSHYGALFKTQGELSMLVQNRVTDQFTGIFYATLTAHFYNDNNDGSEADDSWAIDLNNLPNQIQSLAKSPNLTEASAWSAPGDDITYTLGPLDRSVNRAVLHVLATGSGDDEFWWDAQHLDSTAGPSRFIDVYVGNQFAGFATPYPTIYTGGVNPYLWKPMAGVRTFDAPAHFIDISAFLPALWSGKTTISLNVTNGIDNEAVPSNWIINYNLLTWSTPGQNNEGTTHAPQIHETAPPNDAGLPSVLVVRNVSTSADLVLGGQKQSVGWTQNVAFNNTWVNSSTAGSLVYQNALGTRSVSGPSAFTSNFSYPLISQIIGNQYYHIRQSYNVDSNNKSYEHWLDSTVNQDQQGNFNNSLSRQYLSGPLGAHFAEARNLYKTVQW